MNEFLFSLFHLAAFYNADIYKESQNAQMIVENILHYVGWFLLPEIQAGISQSYINAYYIQSAYSIPTEEKREQELASLLKISDSFKKIVVVGDDIMPYTDDNGIYFTGLFDFLLKDDWL